MLPIICKGKGLIPRVGMIAPILTPFKVDKQTLTVIMRTPGSILKPYFVDPETSKQTLLTNTNFKNIYNNYEKQQLDSTDIDKESTMVENTNYKMDDDDNKQPDNTESEDSIILSIPVINQESVDDETDSITTNLNVIVKADDGIVDNEPAVGNMPVITKEPEPVNVANHNNSGNYNKHNNYNNNNYNKFNNKNHK